MTDEKSPLEQALDLFVYAPVGLAAFARENLPRWIAKGREQVTGQAALARMMGEYAVNEAQKEAEKALRQASSTLDALTGGGSRASEPAPQTSAASPPAAPTAPAEPDAPPPKPSTAQAAPPAPPAAPRPLAPSVDALAIPGYDALSASQVVQRLAGLAGDELEAVRAYESATRGRKTILHRVDQLQNGSPSTAS